MQQPWAVWAEAGRGPSSTRSQHRGPGQAEQVCPSETPGTAGFLRSKSQQGLGPWCPALAHESGTGAAHRCSAQATQQHRVSSKLGLCPPAAMLGSWRAPRVRTRQAMTGRRVPQAQSSTPLPPEVRGAWDKQPGTAPGCTGLPAHAEGGPDPREPWEEVGGPNQDSRQAERLWLGGQGKYGDSANLGEPASLMT